MALRPTTQLLAGVFGAACLCRSLASTNEGPYTVKLHKHSIPLHSDDGVVQHKSAYFGDINVGGPDGQLFQVVFDTGSGHLVLPSALCKTESCKKHRRYKRKASAYSEDIDADGSVVIPGAPRDQITVSFGTGQVTGIFVRDRVCLGGPDEPRAVTGSAFLQVKTSQLSKGLPAEDADLTTAPIETEAAPAADWRSTRQHGCLQLQAISATKMSDNPFAEFPFDGVLGLGLGSLSQTVDFSFIDKASRIDTGAWSGKPEDFQRTFSIFLAVSDNEDSEITFGGYEASHMAENAQFAWNYVQEPEHGYWQIDIRAILVDGKPIPYCEDGTCRAVVDTGTSLLAVPSGVGRYLIDQMRHEGTPGLGCSGPGPVIEFDLGATTVRLEPKDIARPEVSTDGTSDKSNSIAIAARAVGSDVAIEESSAVSSVMSAAAQMCVPMLMHLDLPEPLKPKTFILGEPVLQQYYTAFDMGPEAPRVGFTAANHVAPREALRMFT